MHHRLTGSMFRLYVYLTATLTFKSRATIVTPAMSLQIAGRLEGCPECDGVRFTDTRWYCHDTRVCRCHDCGTEYRRHVDQDYTGVATDE